MHCKHIQHKQTQKHTAYVYYYSACVITSMSLLSFLPQGPLGVAVTYGGDHIPKSPFNVAVAPTLDLSKINITGLGDSTYFPVIAHVPPHLLISALICSLILCRTCAAYQSWMAFLLLWDADCENHLLLLLITFALFVWKPIPARKRKKIWLKEWWIIIIMSS